MNREKSLDDVFSLLARADGREYIGEVISQLEHGLQAAHFAFLAGKDSELILACLFHDVGHLCAPVDAPEMDGLGILNHEDLGAEYLLNLGFSERLANLVKGHVQAKRYLVTKGPGYLERLSPASRGTLNFQGGPMTPEELTAFEADPLFQDKIFVRTCDERAKEVDLKTKDLKSYREMALQLIDRQDH